MINRKTQTFFSLVLVATTFLTPVVAQTTAPISRTANLPSGEKVAAKHSVYLEDIYQMIAEGQIQPVEGLETEVKKVEQTLAASGKKGTILVDKFRTKHLAVVQNLALSLMAENAPSSLRQKRILKINLGQILSDSNNAQ